MECLKQTVKSKQAQNWFHLPNSFLDYEELEIVIMPIVSDDLSRRKNAYYESLQELNGSIRDDSFVEQSDLPLENSVVKEFL